MNKYFISILFGAAMLFSCGQEATKKTSPQTVKETAADSLLMSNLPDTVTDANHSALMDMILGKPKHNIKNIGILVYDCVNDLDMMGPRYVLGESGAKCQLIALKPGNIKTAMGVEIVPNTVIDSVNQLDILIIPGGFKGTIEAAYNKTLHEWIRKIDQNTTYTASVCTGGWILGATGLLQGKRASTGVTAGMDMALAILKDNWGDKYAQAVMLDMEYDPAPPIEGGSPEKTGRLVRWMMKSMYDAGVNPIIDSLENKVK